MNIHKTYDNIIEEVNKKHEIKEMRYNRSRTNTVNSNNPKIIHKYSCDPTQLDEISNKIIK